MKKFKEIPSDIRNGLMAIIITFVGVAGLYSITFPWAGNDDSLPHIDYVWQVSQGHLPKFNEGTVYPFFGKFPYQYVSNHPPLYYMIQAPFMKLPLESGDWKVAVALGRGVNILLGIACILAFAWAGWVFNKGNHLATILLPGVAAFYITFLQVIGNIMNDSVMVLLSTLALTLSYLILRHGLTRKYAYSLAIISALGLLSRSTYIVPLFVSLLAVVISYSGLLERKLKINYRETLKGIGIATVIFIIALIPSSWFYARNFQQSGSFYKSSHGKTPSPINDAINHSLRLLQVLSCIMPPRLVRLVE